MILVINNRKIKVGNTDFEIAKDCATNIIKSLRTSSQKHNMESQYLLQLIMLHIQTGEILKNLKTDDIQKILDDSLIEKYKNAKEKGTTK